MQDSFADFLRSNLRRDLAEKDYCNGCNISRKNLIWGSSKPINETSRYKEPTDIHWCMGALLWKRFVLALHDWFFLNERFPRFSMSQKGPLLAMLYKKHCSEMMLHWTEPLTDDINIISSSCTMALWCSKMINDNDISLCIYYICLKTCEFHLVTTIMIVKHVKTLPFGNKWNPNVNSIHTRFLGQ